jgi:hypothetical protein
MSLITMSIFGVFFLIILVLGILISNTSWKIGLCFIGGIGCFLIGVVGFAVHASQDDEKVMITQIEQTKITKSDIKVYVEFGERTITFETHKDYEEINDSTIFYEIIYYDYYGNENRRLITRDIKSILNSDMELELNKKYKLDY